MKKENWFIRTCKSIKIFFKDEDQDVTSSDIELKKFDRKLKFYRRGLMIKKMLKFLIIAAIIQVIVILICLIFYWTSL